MFQTLVFAITFLLALVIRRRRRTRVSGAAFHVQSITETDALL